jgi:hypothetical protein
VRRTRVRIGVVLSSLIAAAVGVGWAGTANASVVNAPGYVHLAVYKPGTCIDSQYAPPGTGLVMWRCLNTAFEEWHLDTVPIPWSQVEHCWCSTASMFSDRAMGMCMAVENDGDANGTAVVQQLCDTTDPKQWWRLTPGCIEGGGTIESFISEKVLDVTGGRGGNGVPLQIWDNHYIANQLWVAPAGCP